MRVWLLGMTAGMLWGLAAAPAAARSGPTGPEAAALVEQLRDDDVRWNAMEASESLRRLGWRAVPALESALASEDWQQRQMAADVLRSVAGYKPSPAMLRVEVEGLRHDELPRQRRGRRAYTFVFNAKRGAEHLLRHVREAEPLLTAALVSEDQQQRFLCAYILGCAGRDEHAAAVAGVLLPHLRDNDVRNDAIMAAAALYRLGPKVRPYVVAARPSADRQARQLIDLILINLDEGPPQTWEELDARKRMHRVTRLRHDPVAQHDPGFDPMPFFPPPR